MCLSLCLSVTLSFYLSVSLCLCLSVSLSLCLSASLSLCLSASLTLFLFIFSCFLSMSVSLHSLNSNHILISAHPLYQNTRVPHFKNYLSLSNPIIFITSSVSQNTRVPHFKNYLSFPDPSLGGGLEDKDILGVEGVRDLRNLKKKTH
jgi:hypothetical protein